MCYHAWPGSGKGVSARADILAVWKTGGCHDLWDSHHLVGWFSWEPCLQLSDAKTSRLQISSSTLKEHDLKMNHHRHRDFWLGNPPTDTVSHSLRWARGILSIVRSSEERRWCSGRNTGLCSAGLGFNPDLATLVTEPRQENESSGVTIFSSEVGGAGTCLRKSGWK